jgi:hypothetical protein
VFSAMNKTIGLQLVIYGLLLAGLSYLAYHLAPAIAQPTLITGLAGGVLCLLWGAWALAGSGRKALAVLTLVAVSFSMLAQTVKAWLGEGARVEGRGTAAALITLLFVLSIGMLLRVVWSGVVLDASPAVGTNSGSGSERRTQRTTNGKP